MHIEIAERTDLDRAGALVSWLRRPHVDRVVVTLAALDARERERSAEAIRRLFNDCGCTWSAVALVGAGGVALAAGRSVIGVALTALAAAVAGKLLGLAWSRHRLLARLRALRLAATPKEGICHGSRLH